MQHNQEKICPLLAPDSYTELHPSALSANDGLHIKTF